VALAPGDIVDRYRVEAVLGEGGMSVVYRVRHTTLGTLRALKVLSTRSTDTRQRMQTEGAIQARLTHPNIVGVRDVLELGSELALVLDYVHGPELRAVCEGEGLAATDAEVVFRAIGSAVGFAHHRGFVHRDLKPANVLMEVGRDRVVPRVADFGLVKALGPEAAASRTRTGTAMGTPAYMAPEQVADAKGVDRRADLWSLGCLLYVMLTGDDPFVAPSVLGLFHKIATADYPHLDEVRPDVPERLAVAVDAMLQPDPRQRAADVVDVLDFLAGRADEIPRREESLQRLPAARDVDGVTGRTWLALDAGAGAKAATMVQGAPPEPEAPAAASSGPLSDSEAPAAVAAPRRRLPLAVVVVGVLGGALAVGAGGAMGYRFFAGAGSATLPDGGPAPEPSPVDQAAPPPPREPGPATPPPPAPDPPTPEPPTPDPPTPDARTPDLADPDPPEPEPEPDPAPAAAPPAPAAAPSEPQVELRVVGADSVVLVRDGARLRPPTVPPGTYTVLATFDGAEVPAGEVTVPEVGAVTLSCQAAMRRCALR